MELEYFELPLDTYFIAPGHVLGGKLYQKTDMDDGYRYWTAKFPDGMSDDTFPDFTHFTIVSEQEAKAIMANCKIASVSQQ